jgi:hypothetical protein
VTPVLPHPPPCGIDIRNVNTVLEYLGGLHSHFDVLF